MAGWWSLIAAAAVSAGPEASRGAVEAGMVDGAAIFRAACSVCHGEKGDGDSFAAKDLHPPPRNFTDPVVARSLTRQQMLDAVTRGRPDTGMAAFEGQLTPEQMAAVVDYVRDTFMSPRQPGAPPREDELQVGRRIYNTRCFMCHGYAGDARTRAARELVPPPRAFTDPEQTKSLDVAAMEDAVRRGKEGTGMKPYEEILAPREIRAVIAFIRAAFMEKRLRNIAYHSYQNGWMDFDLKYRSAILYMRYTGDEATLTPVLAAGRQTYEVACVACHVSKQPPATRGPWSRIAESR